MIKIFTKIYYLLLLSSTAFGQSTVETNSKIFVVSGVIQDLNAKLIEKASVSLLNTDYKIFSDKNGAFEFTNLSLGTYTIQISAADYATITRVVSLPLNDSASLNFELTPSARKLDEVVVTGQKKEEVSTDVPISITSLSAKQIAEFRIWDSKDISALVPNLYSSDPGDNRNVVSVRGITSSSYDPAVVTYIDGICQFSLDTYISQLFDVDKIEVLKGPQGTLYGRNAMGGVINISTKQPSNILSGYAEVSIGNYSQKRYSLGFKAPLIKNQLFFGAAFVYDSCDGYYRNDFNNTSFDKQTSFTGNYYLKYIANSRLSLVLNVKNHSIRNNGAFPLTISPTEDAIEMPFTVNQDAITRMTDNIYNGSVSLNYHGRKITIVSQTAYQFDHRYYIDPIDADFSPIDGISIKNNYKNYNEVNVITEEIRFEAPAFSKSPYKWLLGSFSFSQNNPVKQATIFGEDAAMFGAQPNSAVIITSKNQTSGSALYGHLTYTLKKKLDFTYGMRLDYEHKRYRALGEFQPDLDANDLFIIQSDTTAIVDCYSFLPKAALLYRFTSNNSIFVSYSKGYKTGGLTQLSSDPSNPPLYPYQPEYSNNIEIGSKNNFLSNKLTVNISGFATYITNVQVPTLVLPDAVTIIRNGGKLRNLGIEVEAIALPAKGLEIMCNSGFTDSRYTNLYLSQNGNIINFKGNRQVFTPEFTTMLSAQYIYEFHSKQKVKLVTRIDLKCIGKQYFDLANVIEQDTYNLLSIRCGAAAKNFEVFFWAKNLSDTKYISYAYDFGAVHLGNPAVYGLTLNGKF